MAKTFELLASAELVGLIGAVGKTYAKAEKQSQLAAVHAVGHCITTGDIRYINSLFDALNKSTRKQSFVAWAEKHAPVAYMSKDKKFAYDKSRADMTFDGNKLLAIAWFDAKQETVVSTIDVADAVTKLLKRVSDAASNGKDVKNLALVEYLNAAVAKFHGDVQDELDESDVEMGVRTGTEG